MKINIELETYCHKLISRGLCRTVGEISHGQFNLVYHSNTGVVCFHPAKILVEQWGLRSRPGHSSTDLPVLTSMCQQRGYEVERQGKANKSTTPRTADALGGIRIQDALLSRPALYQLSYQGNSAGSCSNLQHKEHLTPPLHVLWHSIISLVALSQL